MSRSPRWRAICVALADASPPSEPDGMLSGRDSLTRREQTPSALASCASGHAHTHTIAKNLERGDWWIEMQDDDTAGEAPRPADGQRTEEET